MEAGHLSHPQRKHLSDAHGPAALRETMMRIAAQNGQQGTLGTETRQAAATLANMETILGKNVVPALNVIKEGVGKFLGKDVTEIDKAVSGIYHYLVPQKQPTRIDVSRATPVGNPNYYHGPLHIHAATGVRATGAPRGAAQGASSGRAARSQPGAPAHSHHTVHNELSLRVRVDRDFESHVELPSSTFHVPLAHGSGNE